MSSFLKLVDSGGLVFLSYIKLSSCASVEIKGKESSIHMRNRIGHLTVTVRNKIWTEISENTVVYTIIFKYSLIERNDTKASSLSRFQMNITSTAFEKSSTTNTVFEVLFFWFVHLLQIFHFFSIIDIVEMYEASLQLFLWKSHFCHVLEHTVCEW